MSVSLRRTSDALEKKGKDKEEERNADLKEITVEGGSGFVSCSVSSGSVGSMEEERETFRLMLPRTID